MQHLQKTEAWGVLLFTSFLCLPTFQPAYNCPLLSIAFTLFHFPNPATPVFATLTKTAGCVPTIPILELHPRHQSKWLFFLFMHLQIARFFLAQNSLFVFMRLR